MALAALELSGSVSSTRARRVQENRILTPILFSLLLLIVFFVWVNVMVAIISEVYAQEVDRSLNIIFDEDFRAMLPDVLQPGNDMEAMQPHAPRQTHPFQAEPAEVALTADRCAHAPRGAALPL
jgi:Polycystin cation channel